MRPLAYVTLVAYAAGRALPRFRSHGKAIVAGTVVLQLGQLAVFKYTTFLLSSVHDLALLFGADLAGRPLEDFHAGDPVPLKNFLQRCASTTGHMVGSLLLTASDGSEESYRLRGTRAALSHGAAVLLRVDHQDEERFAELTRKLGALDREVRDRMHAEAVLAETVRERELLLRELQHRVKNNMHMLQSLLAGAERESETDEAKHALRDVSLRVSAIGLVQQFHTEAHPARDQRDVSRFHMQHPELRAQQHGAGDRLLVERSGGAFDLDRHAGDAPALDLPDQ